MSDLPVHDTNDMMRRRNLRVTEQLLAELEAKRFDSALVKRILAAPSAFPYLLRACFLAQEGKLASARADIDTALGYSRQNPVVELVAGMILYATRDYQRALDQLRKAATLSPNAAHRARQQIVGAAGNLGWEQDVRAALDEAIAAEPHDPSWHAQAVRFYVRGRHFEAARDHARLALELAPNSARMWMEAAGIHAALDERDPARAALVRALELMPPAQELAYRTEAVRVAIDAGAFELATDNLTRATALDPDSPAHAVTRAELASWSGALDEARAATEAALALDPEFGPALRMRGALEVLAGDYEAAIATLTRAIERAPKDSQAHVWLAEAYLRSARPDRLERADAQLHQGTMNAGGFLFVAWLLRFLISAASPGAEAVVRPHQTEEFAGALAELCPELAATCLRTRTLDDTVAAVEAALAALRGNRSTQATHVVDGVLTRLHTRTGCRHACRHTLQLLRVSSGEDCLARFDAIIEAYPSASLTYCHRGELRLWLGDLDGGEADLREAIRVIKGTRWAYIGLSTLGLVRGDFEASLAVNAEGVRIMNGTEGPAIYVYRGEALRKLGRLDDAIPELERAVECHPARASATINLALAYAAAGREAEFEPLWLRLRDDQASGLLSDAAHELDVVIWPDDWAETSDDASLELAVCVAVLERALEMMGGNRSSGLITYRTRAGALRFVQPWPHRGVGPHARDHDHLDRTKRLLLEALARYQGPRR